MSDGRPTEWTRTGADPTGELWEMWAAGCLRLSVSNYWARDWDWEIVVMDGHRLAMTLRKWGADPTLPTRELAQAAAEQWVREWATGLLAAVGPGDDCNDDAPDSLIAHLVGTAEANALRTLAAVLRAAGGSVIVWPADMDREPGHFSVSRADMPDGSVRFWVTDEDPT